MNVVTENCQFEEPKQFAGGIIADPMGLGKTLTMISLVATDPERSDYLQIPPASNIEEKVQTMATLIIVPPSCMHYLLLSSVGTQNADT